MHSTEKPRLEYYRALLSMKNPDIETKEKFIVLDALLEKIRLEDYVSLIKDEDFPGDLKTKITKNVFNNMVS